MFTPGLVDAIHATAAVRSNKKLFKKRSQAVYRKYVKTYADLLLTNVAFLHGKLMTFYTGYVGLEAEHQASAGENTLVKLQEHGVFTTNGQGNECYPTQRQRSYVDGLVPGSYCVRLIEELEKRNVWYKFNFVFGGVYKTNVTPELFTDTYHVRRSALDTTERRGLAVTQGKYPEKGAGWFTDTMLFEDKMAWPAGAYIASDQPGLMHIHHMLATSDLMSVQVIARDFCSGLADEVLLQCVQAAGMPPLFSDPFAVLNAGYVGVYYGIKTG